MQVGQKYCDTTGDVITIIRFFTYLDSTRGVMYRYQFSSPLLGSITDAMSLERFKDQIVKRAI